MSDAQGRSYSDVGGRLFVLNYPVAFTMVGTGASIAALANSQLVIPPTFYGKVKGISVYVKTGGSAGSAAAGLPLLLQYSLAGTGTYTTIGSCTFGSAIADNTAHATAGVDSTVQLAPGDFLRLATAAGTVAIGQIVHPCVILEETFYSV